MIPFVDIPGYSESTGGHFFVEPGLFGLGEARANEHSSTRSPQSLWIDSGINHSFVGPLDQQTRLRVHRMGLLEVNAKEHGVELLQVVNFTGALRDLGISVPPATFIIVSQINLNAFGTK